MVKVIHILADGTVKNSIDKFVVMPEKCEQIYKVILKQAEKGGE